MVVGGRGWGDRRREAGSDMIGGARVFDLEQPRSERMPIHHAHRQAGYSYLLHRHHEDDYEPEENGPRSGAAGIIICGEHTGTHIDALCHQSDDLERISKPWLGA